MRVLVALLLATAFAGCADSTEPVDDIEEKFEDLDTKATADTGVIRGVVIDETITPLEGATVAVVGTEKSATTDANGIFAFVGLAPGTYFLQISKVGYNATQTSVAVVAGVDRPPIVKVNLPRDPSNAPYISTLEFQGIIQCSIRASVVGYPLCSALGIDEDFQRYYTADRVPSWIQSDMLWETTQTLGDEMSVSITCLNDPSCPDGQVVLARHEAVSPLQITVNQTTAEQYNIGQGNDIWLRVFVHWLPETDPPEDDVYDTAGIDCVEWNGVLGLTGCIRFGGVGLAVDQRFSVFTNIFYGFEPEPGWSFIDDGAHAPPE